MIHSLPCPQKPSLVSVLYGEAGVEERQTFEAHLVTCDECAEELAAFKDVRSSLAAWPEPSTSPRFKVVVDEDRARPPLWRRSLYPVGLAAAATLVLGVSAGIANLEVRYDRAGLVVRTGWGREDIAGATTATAATAAPAGATLAATPVVASESEWRQELTALEARLRGEWAALGVVRAGAATAPAPVATRTADARQDGEILKQVQSLLDESEVRQQQNLALRVTELSRDFELQRRADLVQIEQGFGRLEGQRGVDAAQYQRMLNYFQRVSQQAPPQ